MRGSSKNVKDIGALIDNDRLVLSLSLIHISPGVVPDQKESYFQADPGLIREAREAGEAEGLRIFEGRVASGDLFVADEAARRRIAGLFGALCAEMEGAAVAQTCLRNQIPFVIIRSISDLSLIHIFPFLRLTGAVKTQILVMRRHL